MKWPDSLNEKKFKSFLKSHKVRNLKKKAIFTTRQKTQNFYIPWRNLIHSMKKFFSSLIKIEISIFFVYIILIFDVLYFKQQPAPLKKNKIKCVYLEKILYD